MSHVSQGWTRDHKIPESISHKPSSAGVLGLSVHDEGMPLCVCSGGVVIVVFVGATKVALGRADWELKE